MRSTRYRTGRERAEAARRRAELDEALIRLAEELSRVGDEDGEALRRLQLLARQLMEERGDE